MPKAPGETPRVVPGLGSGTAVQAPRQPGMAGVDAQSGAHRQGGEQLAALRHHGPQIPQRRVAHLPVMGRRVVRSVLRLVQLTAVVYKRKVYKRSNECISPGRVGPQKGAGRGLHEVDCSRVAAHATQRRA